MNLQLGFSVVLTATRTGVSMIKLSEFVRYKGSIDTNINEIPINQNKIKIIGVVVSKSIDSIVIGDSTGQLTAKINRYQGDLKIRDRGRFYLNVNRTEENISAELIAFIEMNLNQVSQYQRIVGLEKRNPR